VESGGFFAKVVVGQMYQIFENLISNSVYWLSHHRAYLLETTKEISNFSSTITIEIDLQNRTIYFSDTGPGIDPVDGQKVFDPFFSKKPSGRGIGLYIVKNLCIDNSIKLSLIEEDENGIHKGFRFQFS
jgi:signal transduction histidine kinase